MDKEKINGKHLIVVSVLLGLYLLIRLADYSQIIYLVPSAEFGSDYASYMAQLHFLKTCGFHNFCPYWYNGFTSFITTPPAWFFMTLPIYLATNHVQLSFYIGMLLTYLISIGGIVVIGRKIGWSGLKCLCFFLIFEGNNVAIRILRQGRVHELFAWAIFAIAALIILYYKDRKIDKNFYWVIPLYSLTILGYHSVAVLLSFLFVGIFLIKTHKERFIIAASLLASYVITSFWWVPLLGALWSANGNFSQVGAEAWWQFNDFVHFTPIAAVGLPLLLLIFFFAYVRSKQYSRKDFLFFLPVLGVAALFLVGGTPYIPVLNNIFTNVYFQFMIFFITYFLFETHYKKSNNTLLKYILIATITLSIVISFISTPFFNKQTKLGADVFETLKYIENNEKYLIVGYFPEKLNYQFYSLGPLYFNLSTSGGWYPHLTSAEHIGNISAIYKSAEEKDCNSFTGYAHTLKTTEFIGYDDTCNFLKNCNGSLVVQKSDVCLYKKNE